MNQNNNWEKDLDDEFGIRVDEKVEGKIFKDIDYGDFYGQRNELKEFIKEILQSERTTLLEEIKKEIENSEFDENYKPDITDHALTEVVGDKYDNFREGHHQGLQDAISIINKYLT